MDIIICQQLYWSNNSTSELWKPNGFQFYPASAYDRFLTVAHLDEAVLDLGCGNGLLLRHLAKSRGNSLVPYGVDHLPAAIDQAQNEVLPQFSNNFYCSSIEAFKFACRSYDWILIDPFNIVEGVRNETLLRILQGCRKGLVLYTYADALKAFSLACPCCWPEVPSSIRTAGTEVNYPEVSFHIIPIENNFEYSSFPPPP